MEFDTTELFFCGYIKAQIYGNESQSLGSLEENIRQVIFRRNTAGIIAESGRHLTCTFFQTSLHRLSFKIKRELIS